VTDALERATIRKVSVRLLPVLFVLYIAAYLDRTNVGLAALQMNAAIGMSAAAYGFGAGVFFIGYGLFEVPSNLVLARVGARRWIARIALTWGVIACATMFVRGPTSFYVLRFLLGAAEAGAFPGIIYYLSEWFPERQRARALSRFMVSVPLAGVIGGPVGGALLTLDGRFGLGGWQWLFFIEGIPSIILGLIVLVVLVDRPNDATWLKNEEREWLTERLAAERRIRERVAETSAARALTSGVVWWLALLYFLALAAYLGTVFFGPAVLSDTLHVSNLTVGYIMGGTGIAGVVGMLLNGANSDRTNERIAHSAVPMFAMALGFAIMARSRGAVMLIAGLALISFSMNAFFPVYWCLPAALLSGPAAAGGIALINSIGNLGGFVAPNIVGYGKTISGGYAGSMWILGGFAVIAGLMTLALRNTSSMRAADALVGAEGAG
jgi:ACS family tartrate transporter-like MFS transporter